MRATYHNLQVRSDNEEALKHVLKDACEQVHLECRVRVLPATVPDTMWPVATTKRLLDTGADDARDDHEAKRHKDDALPMEQEPSSSSGVKRANVEAIRRADAEAEKALKRAKVLEERRAAKRASATPMDELEESCDERRGDS